LKIFTKTHEIQRTIGKILTVNPHMVVVKNPKSKLEAEGYLDGMSQESTPEDARLPARRASSSERRTAISMVAAGHS
jgi:hypothetical protein